MTQQYVLLLSLSVKYVLSTYLCYLYARETAANGAGEWLRLPCACGLCCDSIQVATCLLTNEVGLAPVSNRVALGKLVTEKPVDFVGFDYVVEFNKNRQNDDNVVKAYKDLFS